MAAPVVAVFEAEPWLEQYFAERLPATDLHFFGQPLDPWTAREARDANILSVFIRSRVDADVLEQMPFLQFVATRSTGFDHVEVGGCRERGIVVSNVPHYGENTVAEHTFGLILNLSRHIHEAHERTARCDFSLAGLEGMDLKGKTIGVVGAGHIGLHVIRIARGFDMNVLAYDVQRQPILAEVLGFAYVELDDLLARSDVVSLHLPLNERTYHLLDHERFSRMKRGAFLVNTARGATVDTEALIWALDEGILAGAGLDVLEGEEHLTEDRHLAGRAERSEALGAFLCGHALLQRENVIVTPHMAFYSREARLRIAETTADNIRAFLAGRPQNAVA